MAQSAGIFRPRALTGLDALWRLDAGFDSRMTGTAWRKRQKKMNRTAESASHEGQKIWK